MTFTFIFHSSNCYSILRPNTTGGFTFTADIFTFTVDILTFTFTVDIFTFTVDIFTFTFTVDSFKCFSILRRNTTGGGKRTRSSTELMSSAISTVRLEISFFFLRDHDCFPRDRFVPGGGPLCLRRLPLRPQPDAGAGCRDAWKQGDIISITNLLHIRRISFVWATSTSTLSPSMC